MPNRFVVVAGGHYVRLANRYGSFAGFQVTWIEQHIEASKSFQVLDGFKIWLRGVYCNDRDLDRFTWYIDCLYESTESAVALFDDDLTEQDIAASIQKQFEGFADQNFKDCIYHIDMRLVNRSSDSYDPNHYSFYQTLPADL